MSKGKGRGKQSGKNASKNPSPTREDEPDSLDDIALQVSRALPRAAILRAQSELLQSEWSAVVRTHQTLDSSGGVSLVPKGAIPAVIRRVAYTTNPTAILISESPDRVGLRGFPRKQVTLQLSAMGAEGERQTVQVERFLVQISYGELVTQLLTGVRVQMLTTTIPMVAKLPVRHGWAEGPLPGSVFMHELTKYVPVFAISELQPREDQSASFLLHNQYKKQLLRASGQNGAFFKQKKKELCEELELLWTDEGSSLEQAVQLAEHELVLGVAEKGSAHEPRYALRFADLRSLGEYAQAQKLSINTKAGRWKCTGVHPSIAIHGALAFLVQHDWAECQVIFLSDNHLVFEAMSVGQCHDMIYTLNGVDRQLRFKAISSWAREMMKESNIDNSAAASSHSQRPKTRAALQSEFLETVWPIASRKSQPGDLQKF